MLFDLAHVLTLPHCALHSAHARSCLTFIEDGLNRARALLEGSSRASFATPMIVLLSDGETNGNGFDYMDCAEGAACGLAQATDALKATGIIMFWIGWNPNPVNNGIQAPSNYLIHNIPRTVLCSAPAVQYYEAASNVTNAISSIGTIVARACISVRGVCIPPAVAHCSAPVRVVVAGSGFVDVPSRLACRVSAVGGSAFHAGNVTFYSPTHILCALPTTSAQSVAQTSWLDAASIAVSVSTDAGQHWTEQHTDAQISLLCRHPPPGLPPASPPPLNPPSLPPAPPPAPYLRPPKNIYREKSESEKMSSGIRV